MRFLQQLLTRSYKISEKLKASPPLFEHPRDIVTLKRRGDLKKCLENENEGMRRKMFLRIKYMIKGKVRIIFLSFFSKLDPSMNFLFVFVLLLDFI